MRKPRRNHSAAFKARVALETLKGLKSITEIAEANGLHPNQVTTWKSELVKNAEHLFVRKNAVEEGKRAMEDIPLPRGFCYLVAIMDWHSRKVLAWEVSSTMDSDFCLSAWPRAVANAGCRPEIMKYEEVYLRSYATPREAAQGLERWFNHYNNKRPHSSLKDHTPSEVYAGINLEEQVA